MRRPSLLLATLLTLAALAGGACQPRELLPTPPPWTPVPLSPNAISPENAGQVQAPNCVDAGVTGRLAFSPDGATLAVAAGYGVSLYDARFLSLVQRLETPPDTRDRDHYSYYIWSVAFAPDGATVAGGNSYGWVHLWRVGEPQPPRSIQTHQRGVVALAFSADGETLATAGTPANTVCIWRVADGELLRTLEGFERRHDTSNPDKPPSLTDVAFSPDGAMLAWATDDRVNLWRVGDGRLLRRFGRAAGQVSSLTFSADGTMVAAAGRSGGAVWRTADGGLLAMTEWSSYAHLTGAGLSPDGRMLALGGLEGAIGLYRLPEALSARTQSLRSPHTDRVLALAFSPDGATLASGSKDGTLCLWGVAP